MNPQSDNAADGHDLMLSQQLLEDLRGETYASAALQELFIVHGRRPFTPDPKDLGSLIWSGRGARQHFARAISVLHVKGYIRWLPGGRYKIVTDRLLTVAEYRARHPAATWRDGLSWPEGELSASHDNQKSASPGEGR